MDKILKYKNNIFLSTNHHFFKFYAINSLYLNLRPILLKKESNLSFFEKSFELYLNTNSSTYFCKCISSLLFWCQAATQSGCPIEKLQKSSIVFVWTLPFTYSSILCLTTEWSYNLLTIDKILQSQKAIAQQTRYACFSSQC